MPEKRAVQGRRDGAQSLLDRVRNWLNRQPKERLNDSDVTNPWFALQDKSTQQENAAGDNQRSSSTPAPSRWVSDSQPGYGMVDEESTAQQLEQQNWRGPLRERSQSQYFRPYTRGRSQNPGGQGQHKSSLGSILLWQGAVAAVLLGAGVYAHNGTSATAMQLDKWMARAFATDWTGAIVPRLQQAFAKDHISLPTFGDNAAITMHTPVRGAIIADYSKLHPEIWLKAAAGTPVLAAGTGTVIKVQQMRSNWLIEIDNGSFGTTIYNGVTHVSVVPHEYVYAGQTIARMPTTSTDVILRFSMVKNGAFEDPHDFIAFPGSQS